MEHNRRLLGCQRKIRSFRANFEKMIAVAQYSRIQILTAGNFRILDVCFKVVKSVRSSKGTGVR